MSDAPTTTGESLPSSGSTAIYKTTPALPVPTTPTGIAGAEANAPHHAVTCHVCGTEVESPHAIRGLDGAVVAACSAACAAAPGFRPAAEIEVERLRAEIAGMREV